MCMPEQRQRFEMTLTQTAYPPWLPGEIAYPDEIRSPNITFSAKQAVAPFAAHPVQAP